MVRCKFATPSNVRQRPRSIHRAVRTFTSHKVVCRGSLTPDLIEDNLAGTPTRKLPLAMRKLPGLLLQEGRRVSYVCPHR